MSIIYHANVFECDGPDCRNQVVQQSPHPMARTEIPTDWTHVQNHEQDTVGWVFCSTRCLHGWTAQLPGVA